MSKVEIRGEQYAAGDLFSDKFFFSVPPYQRSYAWTTEHAGELLEYLLGYLGDGGDPVDELNPYFLGSIVLIKSDRPEAQIVDGQQRLISLTILLAALRSLIPEHLRGGITRRLYEPANPLSNIPARFRLRPKERDGAFFQECIQAEGGIAKLHAHIHADLTDSQRNMRENALHYAEALSRLPEVRRIRLAQFILQRTLLVVVSTPDLNSAYRIFSVLNDRGLDLTSADILKAEIIGQFRRSPKRSTRPSGMRRKNRSAARASKNLIRHIQAIYRKYSLHGMSVLDGFRAHVMTAVTDPHQLIDDVLVPYGSSYYVINSASYHNPLSAERINGLFRWLNRLDNGTGCPRRWYICRNTMITPIAWRASWAS